MYLSHKIHVIKIIIDDYVFRFKLKIIIGDYNFRIKVRTIVINKVLTLSLEPIFIIYNFNYLKNFKIVIINYGFYSLDLKDKNILI